MLNISLGPFPLVFVSVNTAILRISVVISFIDEERDI